MVGALATAFLFTVGKAGIGLYIGHSNVAAGFGAAGTIIIVLVWLYYSAVIFLAGAEFTRAWANRNGSRQATPVPAKPGDVAPSAAMPARAYSPGRAGSAIEEVLVAMVPLAITVTVLVAAARRAPAAAPRPRR